MEWGGFFRGLCPLTPTGTFFAKKGPGLQKTLKNDKQWFFGFS
jgi:hypothetical protein